ncbi:MAG: hypothetical protein IJ881_10090, partial [Neisseriaceae bacterium]|nr:hypothetical protein [Neisseriaceae bacterium]
KISYDWQNTPENFAKLDNDFQTMKDSFKIIANLNEYTATQVGVSLSKHTENTAKLDLSGQPESVLQYIKMANHPFIDDEPYFNALTPEQQVFVRQYLDSMNNESEQNQTVSNNEIHPDEISWRDEIVYLSLRYEEIDGVSIYHDSGLMNKPLNQLSQVELEDRLNIAEYLLSEAMVRTKDRQVWNDLQKQVNEVQNEMEHRKQQEVQPAAENGDFSLSNTQPEKENTMNTQNDTIFQFSNGYTVVISDYFEQEIKENNGRVDDFTQVYIYHKDRITPVAEYWYSVDCLDSEKWAFNQDSVKSRSEFVLNKENENPTSAMDYVQEPYGHRKSFSVNILGNPNWKEDLARAMVDFAVSYEVKTGLNADKEVSGSPEIVSVTRDNYYAANRYYAQNTAQNPVFLAEDDNAIVMPFDDFVIAAMKDTGDSREEIIAFANEAFRSQYQAADGYLRAAHDSSTMFNSFDIEIEDKTYYATAPLEWVKEQARVGLSDRAWDLENARHNFLHSSLDEWEMAFHQLKAAADDYQQWRNQVCAFFNFRQPEITLQQDEWTQVAQFVNYNQEWEQLDNSRLMIAEFTPQQAFEFLGVYQQYQRYVSLAEHNAEQGVDNTAIDKQIAALEQSLNEKVAQNLSPTENRQVMFDLFGTQLGLFDEETQEQGVASENRQPESQNTDSVRTLPNNAADWVLYYQATGKMPDFSLYGNSKDYEKLFLLNSAAMSIGVSQKNFEKFLRAVSNNTFVDKIGGGLRLASSRFGSRAYPNWEASELLKTYGLTPVQWSYLWDKGVFDDFEKIDILDITEYRKERP